uniref:NADH dehydrogenase subunit 6 n=1 Tax=Mahmutkashgaria sulcatus TaxID=2008852 RepID=A0A7S5DC40_9HEMI|nr:NADH dehydrogenase subunit 6 [Mahmutkashgaria sulcatus]
MKLIQILLTMNSLISMSLNHPISLGSMLMWQSITTTLFTIFMTKNSWYSMILFITFSSGVMIMFMYMSSISSNEKFNISFKMTFILITTLTLMILINKDKMLIYSNKWMEENILIQENEEKKSIFKMLLSNKIYMTTLLTLMILMMLIVVSNLINSFEGPLKMTYEK